MPIYAKTTLVESTFTDDDAVQQTFKLFLKKITEAKGLHREDIAFLRDEFQQDSNIAARFSDKAAQYLSLPYSENSAYSKSRMSSSV